MLATQVRQKGSVFYFVACSPEDVLAKVRFISRFPAEGDRIVAEEIPAEDEVGSFIPQSRPQGGVTSSHVRRRGGIDRQITPSALQLRP